MSAPTGGVWRNSNFAPVLSRVQAEIVVLQAAVQGQEASYSSTHFSTIIDAFDDVQTLLDDIQTANSTGNPDPS